MVLKVPYIRQAFHGLEDVAEICFLCGVCCVFPGHSCPAQYDQQFRPTHTYVYDCLGNETPTMNPNLWQCVSCHKCEDMCPYEVSPLNFIDAMKQKALNEGVAPESILSELRQVVYSGYAFPITSNTARLREKLGLEPIEPTDKLCIIAKETGLALLIEIKEENSEV